MLHITTSTAMRPFFRCFCVEMARMRERTRRGKVASRRKRLKLLRKTMKRPLGSSGRSTPYKVPANWEVAPEETVASSMERGLHLQGFIQGQKGVRVCSRVDAFAKDSRRRRVTYTASNTMTASSIINRASAARTELD